jgi:hypothetical protein
LFNLIRSLPSTLRYENQLIVAEGDYVIAHGRFSGHGRPAAWVAADVVRFEDGKLAEHWDVLQDEATRAESASGLPMFGDRFPAWASQGDANEIVIEAAKPMRNNPGPDEHSLVNEFNAHMLALFSGQAAAK